MYVEHLLLLQLQPFQPSTAYARLSTSSEAVTGCCVVKGVSTLTLFEKEDFSNTSNQHTAPTDLVAGR